MIDAKARKCVLNHMLEELDMLEEERSLLLTTLEEMDVTQEEIDEYRKNRKESVH